MPMLRFITVVLLAASAAVPLSLARAQPLEPEECKALEAEKRTLLTPDIKAALEQGPDWVKEHLHSADQIERVRYFLTVEEKIKFRCRTDGVVIPEPKPVPLPDRKPEVPRTETADVQEDGSETDKVLADVASTSLLPLRKPSLSPPESGDGEPEQGTADAEETSDQPDSGPSQTVADSDKTAPSQVKATQ